MNWKQIQSPFSEKTIRELRTGEGVLISGILYTARDKAHERLCALIEQAKTPPFNLAGQTLYYAGPSPAPPGKVSGSAGPTTSSRMDVFSETILSGGIKGMIGKGKRDEKTKSLIKKFEAPYLSSFGGAGAYLASRIISSKIIAFEDLGPEAVYEITVSEFPAVVINDIYGGDLYEDALRK
ncbi:MAG: FumA C-terminus/TtdB family hydratase beta subunit [Leptospirales bacterium]|nr:FumA C-terminus/TtdB family hydratase beta subunit [Leptospirales bacterium]